ncbi:MAG: VWA domain-containing protein [Spirochaetaceae bacterium]|jgi:Ca-activated chloride channel family protein|nr:VWA domain-containing protein [Spirochaetaceae bacterium]
MIAAHPESWVYLLALPVIIVLSLWAMFQSNRALKQLGYPEQSKALQYFSLLNFIRTLAFIFFFVLLVVALLDLHWGREPKSSDSQGLDMAIVMDLSYSMLIEEQQGSRLNQGKENLLSLLNNLDNVRYSFIPFKGNSMVALPLTEDLVVLQRYISIIEPQWLSSPGSNMEIAIYKAMESLKNDQDRNKVILLITDGEELQGSGTDAARSIMNDDITLVIMALGGNDASPIYLNDGSTLKDAQNRQVLSRPNHELLQEMARVSDGRCFIFEESGSLSELQQYLKELTEPYLGIRYYRPMKYRVFLLPAILLLFLHQLIGRMSWRKD